MADYSEMERDQLKQELENRGIQFKGNASNEDLAELLEADDEAQAEATDSGESGTEEGVDRSGQTPGAGDPKTEEEAEAAQSGIGEA